MKKKKTWMIHFISTILILGIFGVGSLFLINVGMNVYKNVVLTNNNNFQLRTSLSYIATKIRQCDSGGMVSVKEVDGKQFLVLGELYDGEVYETVIYYQDGTLYELFQKDGFELNPENGFATMEVGDFNVEELSDGGIHLTVWNQVGESEELTLYLRSGR